MINLKTVLFIPILSTLLLSLWISFYSPPPTDYGSGSMFDKIAPRYDLVNRVLAFNLDKSWRKTMVRQVVKDIYKTKKEYKEPKILDLATGTADVAILLGETILKRKQKMDAGKNKGGKKNNDQNLILGIDPSSNMIDIGKSKVSSKNLDNVITLEVGDGRDLSDLKSNSFDAVTMAFGIRNIPERQVALCEIHRVLKKKKDTVGKLYILEFSEPESNTVMGMLAKVFIRYIVPVLGAILSGAPKEYIHLQNSIKEFPASSEFVKEIENVTCGTGRNKNSFYRVDKVNHMNYGSVQLYVATAL